MNNFILSFFNKLYFTNVFTELFTEHTNILIALIIVPIVLTAIIMFFLSKKSFSSSKGLVDCMTYADDENTKVTSSNDVYKYTRTIRTKIPKKD